MNLGINLVALFPGKIGGGEQYSRNIVALAQSRKDINLFLFLNDEGINTFHETENARLFAINVGQDIDTQLNFYIDDLNLDMWFCPLFHLLPKHCTIPSAVMIFDIQQNYFPRNFRLPELYQRKVYTKHTVEAADLLLTISEYSKSTLVEKYKVSPERIKVTWLDSDGVFGEPLTDEGMRRVKDAYMLPGEYIYFPANTWPHKNHMRLLKAFLLLKKKKDFTPKLVLTGAKSNSHSKIGKFINKHGLQNEVIYPGYIPQADMPYVFANANMLVFPSLFEGFGIPLIESMRSGIPVACSNSTSLPEIGGDAALYFDGFSVKSIAEGIYRLYTDDGLRKKLIAKGKERAALFSWEKCAEETLGHITKTYREKKATRSPRSETPLVSVITPSYNQGQFIKETIDSVLSQDYPNVEYIVIDGGSTDETVDILRSYGDRIKWVSEKDDGQADAVDKGLKIATGEIIGWLNSDDTYTEGAIRTAVDYLESRPDTDMVYGEGWYMDKDSVITGRYNTEKYSKSRLAETCFICQPSAFFRKSLVDRAGGLDASLHLCMDYELWMRFANFGKISYIPEYLACSRMYAENKTSARRKEIFKEVCASVKKHYGYLPMQWTYGYADYLLRGARGRRFKCLALVIFLMMNIKRPGYAVKFVLKRVYRIAKGVIPVEPFDGMYADRWVSKQYNGQIAVREAGRYIDIKGRHQWPINEPLQINVFIDSHPVGVVSVEEKGEFARSLDTGTEVGPGIHHVRLIMNQVFVPHKLKISADKRNLSFILDSLEVRS